MKELKIKEYLKHVLLVAIPGSGKSYTLSKITSGQISPRLVNTDIFEEKLNIPWTDKTKKVLKSQLKEYLNSMLPLYVEGTSANPDAILRRNGILQSIGYDTALIWINCSLETALNRTKQRKRKVPEDLIINYYKETEANKPFYKKMFPLFFEINNDIGELTNDIILDSFKKVNKFFNSEIQNPIGIKNLKHMKEQKCKYLFNCIYKEETLKKYLNSWYG